MQLGIKDRYGEMIYEEEIIIKRWEEYIGRELYKDERETLPNIDEVKDKFNRIDEKEVRENINELPKGKAAGEDGICAEFLQNLGERGIQL